MLWVFRENFDQHIKFTAKVTQVQNFSILEASIFLGRCDAQEIWFYENIYYPLFVQFLASFLKHYYRGFRFECDWLWRELFYQEWSDEQKWANQKFHSEISAQIIMKKK